MIDYFSRCWRGEQPFWHVFWIWVVLVNGVWLVPSCENLFFGTRIVDFLMRPLGQFLSEILTLAPFVLPVTLTPFTLIVAYRCGRQSKAARLTSIFLWVLYVPTVGAFYLVFGTMYVIFSGSA